EEIAIDKFLVENSFHDLSVLLVNCCHCRQAVPESDLHGDHHDMICTRCYELTITSEERTQRAALNAVAEQELNAYQGPHHDEPAAALPRRFHMWKLYV